jgi:hypothetical protein
MAKTVTRLLILILLLSLCGTACAQGCIMCKQAAEATPAAAQLNLGILVLLVPALTLFTGIIALLYYTQRGGRPSALDQEPE